MVIYNSFTRKKEEFQPVKPPYVGMYTCGPTVYDYASIGNFRTYVASDILRRVLVFNGYKVKSVMNVTDVGHLTGDNLGDADTGRDRLEIAAEKEHKTAWDIAKFYTEAFMRDMGKMGILPPEVMPRATEHIREQIDLIRRLAENGFTYKISDGIYFDTVRFETGTGKEYGKLSTMDEIKAGARVEQNPEKKDPRDFALWKFSEKPGERHMEWESPWGLGFPGWHIECSAMSLKYLTESFDPFGKLRVNGEYNRTIDIHVGGEDLRQTHHPNEIAQSEGATGKPFVKYWVHTTFLLVDGQRMGKSLGNIYRVSDIEEKEINPLALRYLYLTAHYRDPLNFTWESLKAAQKAYERLKEETSVLKAQTARVTLSVEKENKIEEFKKQFLGAVNDDLSTPKALSVLWEMLGSNIPSRDKLDLLHPFNDILGLGLRDVGAQVVQEIPLPISGHSLATVVSLSGGTITQLDQRELVRMQGDFGTADVTRKRIEQKEGIKIEDTPRGPIVKPLKG